MFNRCLTSYRQYLKIFSHGQKVLYESRWKVPRCCHQTVPGQDPPSALHLSPAVTLGVSGDRSGGRSRKNILRSVGAAARAEGGVELHQFLPRLLTLGCLLAGEGCNDLWHTRLCGDSMEAMRPVSIVSTVYWTYFQQNNSRS